MPYEFTHKFNYIFYWDDEGYEHTYEVKLKYIVKAWIAMYASPEDTIEKQCISVLEQLAGTDEDLAEILKDLDAKTLEEAISITKHRLIALHKPTTALNILDWALGDIDYYVSKDDENLKEYFREDAEEDFIRNGDH